MFFTWDTIGWIAVLAVICFAIVTINIVLILSGSHVNRLHEQSSVLACSNETLHQVRIRSPWPYTGQGRTEAMC